MQLGLVEVTLQLLEAFGVPVSGDQHAAILAFATVMLTFVMNALEDNTALPALLKPSPPANNPVAPPDVG